MSKQGWQSGFDSVMTKRATMHHWHHLQKLRDHRSNREAAAIVQSFEIQMEFETSNYQDQLLAG